MIARSTFSRGTLVGCAVYCRGSFLCDKFMCWSKCKCSEFADNWRNNVCKNAKVFLISWSWFSAQEEVLV